MAVAELTARGALSYATVEAIASSSVPHRILEKSWLQLAETFDGTARSSVAVSATILLDKCDVGREALEYCLTNEHLDTWHKEMLAGYFSALTSESAILWAHDQLVSKVKSDDAYYTFLVKQVGTIAAAAHDRMTTYLLSPDRGPGSSNAYSFFLICSRVAECEPFLERWCQWILEGRFDGKESGGNERAQTLYRLLNEAIEEKITPLDQVADCAALRRMYLFLSSGDQEYVRTGLYHLRSMVATRFKGAPRAFPDLDENVRVVRDQSLAKERSLFYQLRELLRIVARLDTEIEAELDEPNLDMELRAQPFGDIIDRD